MPNSDQLFRNLSQYSDPVWKLSFEAMATVIVVLFAILLYLLASRLLAKLGQRSHLEESLVATLRIIVRWLFVILTAAAVMQVWEVLDQFWAAATAMVTLVAIGFVAVWSVLSNVLCSIILLAARPFRIGQRIALPPDDFEGRVIEITLLHTVLKTDNNDILKIPNNLFFQRIMRIRAHDYVPPPVSEELADPAKPEAED